MSKRPVGGTSKYAESDKYCASVLIRTEEDFIAYMVFVDYEFVLIHKNYERSCRADVFFKILQKEKYPVFILFNLRAYYEGASMSDLLTEDMRSTIINNLNYR